MAETRKLIKASRELKEEIARKLNVTTRTVDAALAYDTKALQQDLSVRMLESRSGTLRAEEIGKPV